MEFLQEMKVRVKNTFLELVEEDEVQPRLLKSQTDNLACRNRHRGDDDMASANGPFVGTISLAATTAAAAASAARAAAQAAAAAAVPQCLAAGGLPVAFGSLNPLEGVDLVQPEKAGRSTPKDSPQARSKKEVPEVVAAAGDAADLGPLGQPEPTDSDGAGPQLTTVMLRNLPNDYSRAMLVELLDSSGFEGKYDFLYLPTDFSRKAGLGYAFVNMVSPDDAQRVREKLEGYRKWSVPSSKVCSVGWSNPCQGLEANVDRYRNSPVMHECVPDEYKPLLLVDGRRVEFPLPTKKLRKPDLGKHNRRAHC